MCLRVCTEACLSTHGHTNRRLVAGSISGSVDKKTVIESIVAAQSSKALNTSAPSTCVYIGDSLTDIAALLQSDVGIIVGSSKSLRRVCAAFGVQVRPLFSAVAAREMGHDKVKGVLYEAASWHEIRLALFGDE